MDFRALAPRAAQLEAVALLFAGIGLAADAMGELPQQLVDAQALQTEPIPEGGTIESPLAENVVALILLERRGFLAGAVAWTVGAVGIALLQWHRIRLATLFAGAVPCLAIGSALVLAWIGTCADGRCFSMGLRNEGLGIVLSGTGLIAIAIAALATPAHSAPPPGT